MSYIGIDPYHHIENFTETKPLESYSKNVIEEIDMLTFNKKQPAVPFGSYIYRIQKYPGDIDLVEQIIGDNKEDVIEQFKKSLVKIVKKIIKKKIHYYSEVKVGLDKRYVVDLGTIIDGKWIPAGDLFVYSQKLYKKKLLEKKEFNAIKTILLSNSVKNGDDYDVIHYIFRERMILRWTADEIINEKKILPGNIHMSLYDALHDESHIKIDEIVLIDGRFVEITNFVALAYYKNGKMIPINVDLEVQHDKLTQLPPEIEKLYFSNLYYSPFKMLKRIYSLARSTKNKELLLKVIPFISSNISLLYQIKSEIDTIMLLIEKFRSIPVKSIFNQLDSIKNRLTNVLEIPDDTLHILFSYIDDANKIKKSVGKIIPLKKINKIIKYYINYETIYYLESVGLNPPTKNLLPSIRKYSYIKRYPSDVPINPKDKYGL